MKRVILVLVLLILATGIGTVVWMAVARPGMQGDNMPSDMRQNNVANNPRDIAAQERAVTVTIKNSAYSPRTITVKKGGTVTWVNEDAVRHNVAAREPENAAGLPTANDLLGQGATYKFTFNQKGTFDYHCTPHPFMTGTVKVVD